MNSDSVESIQEAVLSAIQERTPLRIVGGGSKEFYGRRDQGQVLAVGRHSGITSYEPSELVITARAGTLLTDIEAALAGKGQMLPFEPPHFGNSATLGGTIACGFSGPRRPYTGAARDFVLGVTCINGEGKVLRFGGQVMKNVAGYDISRLMVGAMGTLGVLLEISLKVLPRPKYELTLTQELGVQDAITTMNTWAAKPLPLSAACYYNRCLYLRLSGYESSVRQAANQIGGEILSTADRFWEALREHRLDFFSGNRPLWRLSIDPATAPLALAGEWLLDWGGGQRWLRSDEPMALIREEVVQAGGHALLFRGGDRDGEVFHPLPPALRTIHHQLKSAFDPHGLFNPRRMTQDW